jgi:precorrin-8X/cobalt-precorrin-8 methylmutase
MDIHIRKTSEVSSAGQLRRRIQLTGWFGLDTFYSMPVFDSYLMVDWSAANTSKRGADSIWLGLTARHQGSYVLSVLENPSTRASATNRIIQLASNAINRGHRMLIGFDFPFGFPVGTSQRLGYRGLAWRNLWQTLEDEIRDYEDNSNNRFDVAESLNVRLTDEAFPFWGLPREENRSHLLRRGRRPHGLNDLPERRLCERLVPSSHPVWKLAGAGAVGGQTLTGIPRVWQIRKAPQLAFNCHIWPFETGLRFDPRPAVIIAEIYPSLVAPHVLPGRPKDAGQVAAIGRRYAELDTEELLATLFQGNPALPSNIRHSVETEEAWILGIRDRNML